MTISLATANVTKHYLNYIALV